VLWALIAITLSAGAHSSDLFCFGVSGRAVVAVFLGLAPALQRQPRLAPALQHQKVRNKTYAHPVHAEIMSRGGFGLSRLRSLDCSTSERMAAMSHGCC